MKSDSSAFQDKEPISIQDRNLENVIRSNKLFKIEKDKHVLPDDCLP